MNIYEVIGLCKGIFDIDKKIFKLEKDLDEFSITIDKKLDEIDKTSNKDEKEKAKLKKKYYLKQLDKICEVLIKENTEAEKHNITKAIFDIIKYCIVAVITFMCTKDVVVKNIMNIVQLDLVTASLLCLATIIIVSMLFVLPQWVVKADYKRKVKGYLLRSFIINSKLELLDK